ncbi:MAG TPA: type IV pilus modification protein PilV [Usitatibacter sp.]|nr:type IV pilus modification protein PilV [Usitatibacter sp.]
MSSRGQRGFSMIEVLITIALLMVGLLGLAGLQTRVTTAELEAYQRAQALVIVQDIVDRMEANKKNIASYVANDIGVAGTIDCTGKSGADLDLCQVNNALVGTQEHANGASLGSMIGGRACITSPAANVYIVNVVWQGITPTVAPTGIACGTNAFGDEKLRRAISMPVRVATLSAV